MMDAGGGPGGEVLEGQHYGCQAGGQALHWECGRAPERCIGRTSEWLCVPLHMSMPFTAAPALATHANQPLPALLPCPACRGGGVSGRHACTRNRRHCQRRR